MPQPSAATVRSTERFGQLFTLKQGSGSIGANAARSFRTWSRSVAAL